MKSRKTLSSIIIALIVGGSSLSFMGVSLATEPAKMKKLERQALDASQVKYQKDVMVLSLNDKDDSDENQAQSSNSSERKLVIVDGIPMELPSGIIESGIRSGLFKVVGKGLLDINLGL